MVGMGRKSVVNAMSAVCLWIISLMPCQCSPTNAPVQRLTTGEAAIYGERPSTLPPCSPL